MQNDDCGVAIEEWRDVPDFSGAYQVSNTNRVRSVNRRVPRSDGTVFMCGAILRPDRGGWVSLWRDGVRWNFKVKELVAKAFG